MKKRNRRRRRKKSNKMIWIVGIFSGIFVLCVVLYIAAQIILSNRGSSPEEILLSYMECISEQKYDEMYEMFYPQIGVGKRLDGGRRRVKKYLWSF